MRKVILVLISIFYFFTAEGVSAEEIKTSVVVEAPGSAGIIKDIALETDVVKVSGQKGSIGENTRLEIIKINVNGSGGQISVKLDVANSSESEILLDMSEISFEKLDGTVVLTDKAGLSEPVKGKSSKNITVYFNGSLKTGDYIVKVNLYSGGKPLSDGKSIINYKSEVTPMVLGASTSIYKDRSIIIIGIVIILTTIFGLFALRSRFFLNKSITIRLFDIAITILAVGSFGIGLFGGYFISDAVLNSSGFVRNLAGVKSEEDSIAASVVSDESESVDTVKFVYNNEPLSVYSKPDLTSAKSGEINENTSLSIIDESSGWYRIIGKDGKDGWVQAKYLQKK